MVIRTKEDGSQMGVKISHQLRPGIRVSLQAAPRVIK